MSRATHVVLAFGVLGALLLEPVAVYSHTPITTNVTYQKEIAKIFQRTCMRCHAEGNLAMSLTTYTDARPWAVAIKEEILERRMPPWSAVSGYGHFANDGSLTSREVSVILSWATGGAPSGVLRNEESTPPVIVPALNGWDTGTPDQILSVGETHIVAADSGNTTARFEVATGLAAPKWLQALQFDPGDRRVAQWAAVYEAGTNRWLGGWTPLSITSRLPDGVALLLPVGARLVVEVGYRGAAEPVSGEGSVGLYFTDKRPAAVANPMAITAPPTSVAAGAMNQRVRLEKTMTQDSMAGALWPDLGMGARSLEVTAIRPDGSVEPMLWLEDYKAQWRSPYVFRDPVSLPAGTRVVVTAYFDNAGVAVLQARAGVTVTAWASSRPASTPSP